MTNKQCCYICSVCVCVCVCCRQLPGSAAGSVHLSSQRPPEWLHQVPGDDWNHTGHEPGLFFFFFFFFASTCWRFLCCLNVSSLVCRGSRVDWPSRVPGEGIFWSGPERAERKDGCTGEKHADSAKQRGQRTGQVHIQKLGLPFRNGATKKPQQTVYIMQSACSIMCVFKTLHLASTSSLAFQCCLGFWDTHFKVTNNLGQGPKYCANHFQYISNWSVIH